MRRRLSILAVLCAWLLATGSHWDFIQVFAWGKMMASYSRTMPLKRAVALTFTPGNLCDICRLVESAKDTQAQEGNPAAALSPDQPLVIFLEPSVVVASPVLIVQGLTEPAGLVGCGRSAPPLPPPRGMSA